MKTTFLLFTLILSVGMVHAQTITENYLRKVPVLPKDSCNITRIAMEEFQQNVAVLISEIENEIESLNQAVNNQGPANEEAAKAAAMKQMSQQYGLSPEQMAQMKSGKMSAADKQKMANQILQQQTNMSMGEVKNISKMSEAGRKAYTEALGVEMMANAQAGQNKQAANAGATLQQLIMQQQAVMNKINVEGQRIGNLYAAIEGDANLQKSLQNIDKWHAKIMAMSGVDAGQGRQMDSLAVLIKTTQIKICQNYTPRYRSAVLQHLASMKASMPDIVQLGQITAQLTKMQTSIEPSAGSTEIGCLESIKGYLSKLEDAYQYKLYFAEDE